MTKNSPEATGSSTARIAIRRVVVLLVTAVSLYAVAPALLKVLSTWPDLLDVNPAFIIVVVAMQVLSFVSLWELLRICLRCDSWFAVATSHLSANAFGRVVPGGAATAGALQYRMLTRAGLSGKVVGTGLTVSLLLTTSTVLTLPLLTLPAASLGYDIDSSLSTVAWIGGGVLLIGIVLVASLVRLDHPLRWIGAVTQRVRNRLLRNRPAIDGLPQRLLDERDLILRHLQSNWRGATMTAIARWLFEYGALLSALYAVGARPDPVILLIAFSASALLGMVPLTPGGLGFVEAGLTAMLVLIGVAPAEAASAVLLFRLVSFWLPLPAGLLAYGWYQRRLVVASK